MKNKVILVGLNELNFDYIKYYISKGKLPTFKSLFDQFGIVETTSESEYRLLEPWIQWVTVHTGKTYDEHQIFRLGDIVEHPELNQIFEELESKGKSVAAVSPFNASNKLKNAAFFVPDPWTKTQITGNNSIKAISNAIQDSVNNNANSKLSVSSMVSILFGFLRYVNPRRWPHYIKTVLNKKMPGAKAVVLDSLLSDIFIQLWKKNTPDFSNLFLNSGAHIQHHYLFSSSAYQGDIKNPEWYCPKDYDPFIKILEEYDNTLKRIKNLGVTIILATGLHQNPHKKLTYYWRLKDHEDFLTHIGITNYSSVTPRMSRDFLIEFDDKEKASLAQKKLESFQMENMNVFDVDNRGESLFVELVFPKDITKTSTISSSLLNLDVNNFKKYVSFVAIKNGEHNGIGYLISTGKKISNERIPLTQVNQIIKKEVLS